MHFGEKTTQLALVLFVMCSCIALTFSFPFTSLALIQRVSLSFYKCQVVVYLSKTKGFDLVELTNILAERWENRFYGWLEGGPRAGGGAQELREAGSR